MLYDKLVVSHIYIQYLCAHIQSIAQLDAPKKHAICNATDCPAQEVTGGPKKALSVKRTEENIGRPKKAKAV